MRVEETEVFDPETGESMGILKTETPQSWAELEAKCIEQGYAQFQLTLGESCGKEAEEAVRWAFAFLSRHLPPVSVCMAAEELREALANIRGNWGVLSGHEVNLIADPALKAAEGGER